MRARPTVVTCAIAALAQMALAQPSAAQDWIVYGGGALEFLHEPDGAGSDSTTSLEAYLEAERNGFYGGLWAYANSDSVQNEIDLYAGYRRDLDSGFSYDLAYYRYLFPNDTASNYGELTASLSQTLGDRFLVSTDLAYDPENDLGNAYVGFEFYPAERITVSANYGTYQVDAAPSEQEWDIGVSYGFTDEVALDLRYYDGTDYTDGYVGLKLSFDTTLLGG